MRQKIGAKIWAKSADISSMRDAVLRGLSCASWLISLGILVTCATSWGAGSASLRLMGEVVPQLNVTTSLDMETGTLKLENSSNVENQVFWVQIDHADPVQLKRAALIDFSKASGRGLALNRKQKKPVRITIVSP
jgi:hypothetical protein